MRSASFMAKSRGSMWGPIWPDVPEDKRPVRAITNGVHVPTWLSWEMMRLFDQLSRSRLARPP